MTENKAQHTESKSWADCTEAGQHLKQIDKDGYCVVCKTRPFEELAGPESAKILRRQ
jgi:hypothetical protein